jgi:signal transduction histidine kinase
LSGHRAPGTGLSLPSAGSSSTPETVAALVLHLRDITERRNLESELRHAQKLESVGQLAAGIAHEINTPIQFISNNLQFIAESLTPITALLDSYRTAFADSTSDRAARHQALITQETDIDLNETIRNILIVADSEINPVADVVLDLAEDLPPVLCNLGDINQAVLNLVINAATP